MEVQGKGEINGVDDPVLNCVPSKSSKSASSAHPQIGSSLQRQAQPGDVYHRSYSSKKPRPLGLVQSRHDRCILLNQILSPWLAGQGQPKMHRKHFNKAATTILPELSEAGSSINHQVIISTIPPLPTHPGLPVCPHSKDIPSVLDVPDDLCLPSYHSPQHEILGYGQHYKSKEVDGADNLEVTEGNILSCTGGGKQAQTDRQHLTLHVAESEIPEKQKRMLFKRCLHLPKPVLQYVNFIGQVQLYQHSLSDDRRLASQHEPCERCRLRGNRCPRCLAVRTGGGYIILDQEEDGLESMGKGRHRSQTRRQLGHFNGGRGNMRDGSWQKGAGGDKKNCSARLQQDESGTDLGGVKNGDVMDIRVKQQFSINKGCTVSDGGEVWANLSSRQSHTSQDSAYSVSRLSHTSQSSVHSGSRLSARSRPGSSLGERPGSCTKKHQKGVDPKESERPDLKMVSGYGTERILEEEGDRRLQEKRYDSTEDVGMERNTSPDDLGSALHHQEKEADRQNYRGNMMKFKNKRDNVKAKHATFRELQGIDPLDYLAKYCIVDQSKLPHYHHVFDNMDRDGDDEININELDFALKAVNYDLIADAEMNYIHSVLDLGGRYKLNFHLFSLISALSEKVVALGDMVKQLINKMDFHALEIKMKKCKELFYLLADANAVEAQEGVVTTASLEVELQAGGLTQEHVEFVVDRMNRGGHGFIEFLDYLTYVPLFVDIHDSIFGNPFDFSRTK